MQHSPYEIKEKLLRALDQEYNVVDMAAVFDVISLLEKAIITKDALEKTRIGKYINELRKRTNNEQLARRAKELVKSWRKLLPVSDSTVNGERVICNLGTSPVGVTVLGPGPGPGFGPGPGPGNKAQKSCAIPSSPRYKTASPSIICERSTSPFCSSASNSPQLTMSNLQGSNRPSTPTKSSHVSTGANCTALTKKVLLNNGSQNKSNMAFKPVSPILLAVRHANSNIAYVRDVSSVSQPKPQSPSISPAHLNNSRSCSPHIDASVMNVPQKIHGLGKSKLHSHQLSTTPPITSGSAHSSLDIAKTNAANKRLRKEETFNSNEIATKKKQSVINSTHNAININGMDLALRSSERILPSESSAFNNYPLVKSKTAVQGDKKNDNLKPEKRKRGCEKNSLSDPLREKLSAFSSATKLPKVKTTQQLIEELQARKDALNNPFNKLRDTQPENDPKSSFYWKMSPDPPLNLKAELSRSKSELMKKFLSSSPEPPSNSNHGSPTAKSSVSPFGDCMPQTVPDQLSVISTEKDISTPYTDPVSVEIQQLLSTLPPINPDELNFEEEPLPERQTSVTSDDLERLSGQWEYVNGTYALDGSWRSWSECTESESLGHTLKILPYVNID